MSEFDSNAPREFTKPRAITAEGARVAVVTCLACGAAVFMDPSDEFNSLAFHRLWHRTQQPVYQTPEALCERMYPGAMKPTDGGEQ